MEMSFLMWLSSYSVIAVIAQAKLAISIRRRIGMFNSSIGLKDWVGEAEASSWACQGCQNMVAYVTATKTEVGSCGNSASKMFCQLNFYFFFLRVALQEAPSDPQTEIHF